MQRWGVYIDDLPKIIRKGYLAEKIVIVDGQGVLVFNTTYLQGGIDESSDIGRWKGDTY